MRRAMRWGLVAMLALAVTTAPASAQRKKFEDTTDVVVVEVPIQVLSSKGEPVRGLTAGDFEILDGRKSLPIIGFEEIDLSLTEGRVAPPRKCRSPAGVTFCFSSTRRSRGRRRS